MFARRRFPPPWRIVQTPSGFAVHDATGQRLAYVYGSETARGVNDSSLTMDEARRIAMGIARLPELIGKAAE